MKRSAAILVLAFVLGIAVGALFLASALPCPDCDPTGRGKPSVNRRDVPGCPRCGDAGHVSRFNRWYRRDLDPDVALLLDEPWMGLADNPSRFGDALNRLLKRAGKVESLSADPLTYGSAAFLDDGSERLPLAVLASLVVSVGATELSPTCALVLFDPEGALLDHVTFQSAKGWFETAWEAYGPSDRRLRLRLKGSPPMEYPWMFREGARQELDARYLSVRLRNRRLVVEHEGTP